MTRTILFSAAALTLAASLVPNAQAANYKSTGTGNWGDSSKWSPSGVPNSTGDGVYYNSASGITTTVNSSANYTINGLVHINNGNNTWTIAAGNPSSSLTFNDTGGLATIYYVNTASQNTSLSIDAKLVLGSNLQVVSHSTPTNNKNKQVLINGDITGTGNVHSTITGSGGSGTVQIRFGNINNAGSFTVGTSDATVTSVAGQTISAGLSNNGVTNVNGILASTTGVFVQSGTLNLNGANTYAGGTTVSGGTLNVSATATLGVDDVTIGTTGKLNLSTSAGIDDTATLDIALGATPRVTLNAGVNDIIGSLILNGTSYSAVGTYGSSSSGADFQYDAYFAGTGLVQIVPEPTSLAVLAGLGGLTLLRRRRLA